MKLTEEMIIYCPRCGHSAQHTRLSIGSDHCESTVSIITKEAWLAIAKSGRLRLTEAGRRALDGERR